MGADAIPELEGAEIAAVGLEPRVTALRLEAGLDRRPPGRAVVTGRVPVVGELRRAKWRTLAGRPSSPRRSTARAPARPRSRHGASALGGQELGVDDLAKQGVV